MLMLGISRDPCRSGGMFDAPEHRDYKGYHDQHIGTQVEEING